MKRLFGMSPVANAEGPAGGAAPAAAAAVPAAGPAAASPPAAAVGAPPAAQPAGQAQQAQPAAAYWPEGLDAALKGSDEKATLDNVAKALQGYRQRDASRDIPDKPDGYWNFDGLKDFKIDDRNKPFFDLLPQDPAFKAMAGVMQQHGVGRTAALSIYQAGLNAMAEAGILEPPVDFKAERKALVPDSAKTLPEAAQNQAVQRRVQESLDFLKLMQQTRGLGADEAKYAEMMLGDTAKGVRIIEWMRGQVQGGGQGPVAAGQAGAAGDTRESLQREMAALNRGDIAYAQKSAQLEERYRKLFGD